MCLFVCKSSYLFSSIIQQHRAISRNPLKVTLPMIDVSLQQISLNLLFNTCQQRGNVFLALTCWLHSCALHMHTHINICLQIPIYVAPAKLFHCRQQLKLLAKKVLTAGSTHTHMHTYIHTITHRHHHIITANNGTNVAN